MTTSYQAQREERIRANNQKLTSLGLLSPAASRRPSIQVAHDPKRAKRASRSNDRATVRSSPKPVAVQTRRSPRIAQMTEENDDEGDEDSPSEDDDDEDEDDDKDTSDDRPSKKPHRRSTTTTTTTSHLAPENAVTKKRPISSTAIPPATLKTLLEGFPLGDQGMLVRDAPPAPGVSTNFIRARLDELAGEWVGKVFLPSDGSASMKAAVMNFVGERSGSFSKYSGIQTFSNAILIFVNVGGVQYENVFRASAGKEHDSLLMSWFAQPRHTEESPVIRRLLGGEHVFLFLRYTGGPYLACGKVELVERELDLHPMKFTFKIDAKRVHAQGKVFDYLVKMG